MNISVTILRLCAGLACAVWAIFSANAMAAEAVAPATPEPSISTEAHPVGAWIEKNAAWLGLFWNRKESAEAKAQPEQPAATAVGSGAGAGRGRVNPPEVVIDDRRDDRRKVFTPPVEALQTSDAAAQISAVMKDLEFGRACSNFATPKGFGAWGQYITEQLVRGKGVKMVAGPADLKSLCPAYDYLGLRERTYVWIKIFAAMSFLESSCDPNATAQGPDGAAAGILQLHLGAEHRAASGCSINDAASPIRTLRCGVAILEDQIKRTGKLFSEDTHFGVLRPQGDLIKTRRGRKRVVLARTIMGGLRELPFCRRD